MRKGKKKRKWKRKENEEERIPRGEGIGKEGGSKGEGRRKNKMGRNSREHSLTPPSGQ